MQIDTVKVGSRFRLARHKEDAVDETWGKCGPKLVVRVLSRHKSLVRYAADTIECDGALRPLETRGDARTHGATFGEFGTVGFDQVGGVWALERGRYDLERVRWKSLKGKTRLRFVERLRYLLPNLERSLATRETLSSVRVGTVRMQAADGERVRTDVLLYDAGALPASLLEERECAKLSLSRHVSRKTPISPSLSRRSLSLSLDLSRALAATGQPSTAHRKPGPLHRPSERCKKIQ